MRLLVNNATIVWPGSLWNHEQQSAVVEDGKLVTLTSTADAQIGKLRFDRVIDASDCILIPNGIDLHTHIGGGKANLTRMLLWEREKPILPRFASEHTRPLSSPLPNTIETGQRYLELGYTTCFEPAIVPSGARQAHCEMIDTPHLNTGGFVLLGNDELLLDCLSTGATDNEVRNYVAWMLQSTQCVAVKVVNAGGISAFKYNQREMELDTQHAHWHVTPRQILYRLAKAIDELRLPHPLHVHCSNLGMPANIDSTLETVRAVEGHRVHLTHVQFHAYGSEGPYGFSSAASKLADCVNDNSHVSVDVGQIFFGQTATLSADTMHQFRNRKFAKPNRTIFHDADCQAGCGILPFKYREDQFVNGLQWAIGLELFLLIKDPNQVFLTTDHPNGAPFTSYPHLIKLLMSYDYRMSILDQLHSDVKHWTLLPEIKREYTLEEIVIATRTGPARSIQLTEHFDLKLQQTANFTLFRRDNDLEKMFSQAALVLNDGKIVWDQKVVAANGHQKSIIRSPLIDRYDLPKAFADRWSKYSVVSPGAFRISDSEIQDQGILLQSPQN